MGDRAYTTISIPASTVVAYRDAILAILAPDEESEPDGGIIIFTLDEADAGGVHEAEHLEQLGVPFIASWDVGANYRSGSLVCLQARSAEVPTHDVGTAPIVTVGDDGEPDQQQLAAARRFIALVAEFRRLAASASAVPAASP